MNTYPAYAPDQLLPALRDYLIGAGLVRKPSDGTNLALPPCWLDPKRGIPYPGQTEGLGPNETGAEIVIAFVPASSPPPLPFESFIVKKGVTIWYRAKKSPDIQTMHEQIRGIIEDRRNLFMLGLQVNQVQMTRELQRITSDELGFVYNSEYQFDLWNDNYVYA